MRKRGLAGLGVSVFVMTAAVAASGAGFHGATALETNGGTAYDTKVADFTGDGRPDVIAAVDGGSDRGVYLYKGKANGGVAAPIVKSMPGTSPEGITVGRFNGDKRADVAVSSYSEDAVYLFFGELGGGFEDGPKLDAGPGAFTIATADLNGDGRKDIVTGNYSNTSATGQAVSVLLHKKSRGFQAHEDYPGAGGVDGMAVGRVNGDHTPDVVVQDGDGTVSLLLGRKNGTLGPPKNKTLDGGDGYDNVALGDFTGDGKTDIAAADYSDDELIIRPGKGDGTFRSSVFTDLQGVGPEGIAAGKLDGDRNLDLAVGGYSANTVVVLHGKGNGTFKGKRQTLDTDSASYSMTLGKLSGDKSTDIIDGGSSSISLFLGK